MSIQGIRRIRDSRQTANEVYPLRFGTPSDLVKKLKNTQESQPKKKFDLLKDFGHTPATTDRTHRKTGSLGFSSKDNKDYFELISSELQLDIPIHTLKRRDRNVIHGSISSRQQQRDSPFSDRISSRIESQQFQRKTNGSLYNQVITPPPVSKSNYILEYVVGKGGFGKVWKVKEKKTGQIYAMKEMLKIKIINKKSVNSVMNEKQLLEKLNHPFLVNMNCSFQDKENLYLIMDYINGGDLRYHIGNRRRFTEPESKFFIASIIVALQYLHMNNIIHRDLKPENLVFDDQGYLRVTDLGVSREWRVNNASDTSGTPGYMAPEVICKTDHSFAADFFAVGVMAYEFMLGKRPYVGKNRKQIRDQILAKQAKIEEPPIGWSFEAIDFVNRSLQRRPQYRLGASGISQLKNHPWFNGFDWNALQKKTLKSPFRPMSIEQDYDNYKECISQDTIIEDEMESKLLLRNPETQKLFEGYEFDGNMTNSNNSQNTGSTSITRRKHSQYHSQTSNLNLTNSYVSSNQPEFDNFMRQRNNNNLQVSGKTGGR